MEGKIFPESANIYQDQARILFNYYQQKAEKVVAQEERFEQEIESLEQQKATLNKDLSKANTLKWALCILIIPFIYFMMKGKNITKQIISVDDRINEFRKQHDEIFRDYKVSKLGVAYVPVADQIKYENKSFIVDYTGTVGEEEVKLQLSRQNDLLIETISELENLSTEAPIVESSNEIEEIDTEDYSRSMQHINQHDYFGKLERSLRTISYCMDDLDVTAVSLPLVSNESSYLNFLKEYAANEVPEGAPVFEVFDKERYKNDISKFEELNKLKDSLSRHTTQFEDVLKSLMLTMANSVQAISALKVASTDKIVFESNKILYRILKSPYNHYSPTLEAAEIERIRNESFNYGESVQDYVPFELKDSSRVRYNLMSDMWTAEDGSSTNFPFGVHQIYEEIVAPVVQNLMNENRIERLKIYNHIKDQKISYLNKWHQDTESFYRANRAESADIINLMQASLREYIAAYNTLASLKKTEDSMVQSDGSLDATVVQIDDNSAEVLAAFEMQSKEFQNVQTDFENYMERLKDDIDFKAERFGHIDYYDALLRDGNSKDTAVAANEIHDLDDRRKPLIGINPLLAKTSELPPTPSIESITFEHISLNLPSIAKNALNELEEIMAEPENEVTDPASHSGNTREESDITPPPFEVNIDIEETIEEEIILPPLPDMDMEDEKDNEDEEAPASIDSLVSMLEGLAQSADAIQSDPEDEEEELDEEEEDEESKKEIN